MQCGVFQISTVTIELTIPITLQLVLFECCLFCLMESMNRKINVTEDPNQYYICTAKKYWQIIKGADGI